MPRIKGSGALGPTRSIRLPASLDAWLEERLLLHRDRSVSDILLALIHGGLRLRDGYMVIHRRALEHRLARDRRGYDEYRACLLDTFGPEYVEHLERWLEADGLLKTSTA